MVTEALRLVRKNAAWSAWKPLKKLDWWAVSPAMRKGMQPEVCTTSDSESSCHWCRHHWFHKVEIFWEQGWTGENLPATFWLISTARHCSSLWAICVRRCCHTSGFKMFQEGNMFCCAFAPVLENWWKMGAKVRITKLLQAISGENHQHSSTHCRVAPQEPLSPFNPTVASLLHFGFI